MSPKLRKINLARYDLSGLRVLVTGANTGVGWDIARHYLTLCADVVYIAVRDPDKGEAAKKALLEDYLVTRRNPRGQVHVYQLDLSSFDSVTSFCKKFCEDVEILHIAVLNAGATLLDFHQTVDGMEESFQVNFFSNAILSAYLAPLLLSNRPSKREITYRLSTKLAAGSNFETLPSHLTWVSSTLQSESEIAKNNPIPQHENIIDWFNERQNMSYDRWHSTKLLATAYASELGLRIGGEDLVINSVCPGYVRSGHHKNIPFILRRLMKVFYYFFARTTAEASIAVIWATLSSARGNAEYYSDCVIAKRVKFLRNFEGKLFQSQLWDQTQLRMRRVDEEIPVHD
ncbi:hypothetical protein TWF281_007783 [Arthrobotrys megalospora]